MTGYMLDPGGNGSDYSGMAVMETVKTYESGDNIGNGRLGVVDSNDTESEFIEKIGAFIYENKRDDEIPYDVEPEEDDEEYINNSIDLTPMNEDADQKCDENVNILTIEDENTDEKVTADSEVKDIEKDSDDSVDDPIDTVKAGSLDEKDNLDGDSVVSADETDTNYTVESEPELLSETQNPTDLSTTESIPEEELASDPKENHSVTETNDAA